MSIFETIQADMLSARKAKDATTVSVLSTLVGEIQRSVGSPNVKDPYGDVAVLALIRKNVKSSSEAIIEVNSKITDSNATVVAEYVKKQQSEIGVLEKYIPVQLTETKLREILEAASIDSLKGGMAFLSANYSGQYDGKLASTMLKSMFSV